MPRIIVKCVLFLILALLLTIFTQTGGVLLLLFLPFSSRVLNKRFSRTWIYNLCSIFLFLIFYLSINFTVTPFLARKVYDKVMLPVSSAALKPQNIFTVLFNRHYVKSSVKKELLNSCQSFNKLHPTHSVLYLDANFPLFRKFILFPHLSHNDGYKIDLAFFYTDAKTGDPKPNTTPSPIGYGIFVDPLPGEINYPEKCKKQGFWQYDAIKYVVPPFKKESLSLDKKRTTFFIQLLLESSHLRKIFIEPHLKTRLNLRHSKVRYHGCHAVRHDDHIHLEFQSK